MRNIRLVCGTRLLLDVIRARAVPDTPSALPKPALAMVFTPRTTETTHKFWDKQNNLLFIAAAASSAADFAVTRANLQNGGQELNPVVRVFGRSAPD